MSLSDLERPDARGQNFLADLHYFALMVWSRITKCGTVTQVVKKQVSSGKPCPHPKGGWGPSVPKFFGTYMCAQSMRNNNQILHCAQTTCEEKFYRVDREC